MEAFYALALLACPIGMGAMMWFMARGSRRRPGAPASPGASTEHTGRDTGPQQAEVDTLRAEVDSLRARLDDRSGAADRVPERAGAVHRAEDESR